MAARVWESPAPTNLLALLDRLEYVRGLGIDAARAKRIHPARLGRLLAEAALMTVQHIANLESARRTAILAVQAADLESRLTDATLAMFEKHIGSLFSKAQNRDERRFQSTKRDVAKALLLFRRTIAALKQAQATGEDGVAVVDREVGLKQLDDALPIIGAVADVAWERWSRPWLYDTLGLFNGYRRRHGTRESITQIRRYER